MEKIAYKYKPTKALRKISPIIKHNDLAIIQGGAGAGKTIAILMLLIDYCWRNKGIEVTICSAELSKLKGTAINDFIKITKDWGIFDLKAWNKSEFIYRFDSGSWIEFIGLDKKDVGKGRRRNIIFINEANKITLEKFEDISLRGQKIITDYNPDRKFYLHDLTTDSNFITLTFDDNDFIPEKEKQKILSYKDKGYNEDNTIKNEYYANLWRVYGLGITGTAEGRIYYWKKCTDKDYFDLQVPEYFGVDWGTVDPFAIVGVKIYDSKVYIHEYNYKSENEWRQAMSSTELAQCQDDGIVEYVFKKLNINPKYEVICDTNRPTKIQTLRNMGYASYPAVKGKIIDRISLLQEKEVYYTDSSKNLEYEQENSCWKKDRAGLIFDDREDLNNHLLDAIEYVIIYLKLRNII